MDIKTKKLIVNSYARGKEDQLVQAFIVAGPTAVKKTLGIRDAKWMVIFDYLVFTMTICLLILDPFSPRI